jgi:hypothetical protein
MPCALLLRLDYSNEKFIAMSLRHPPHGIESLRSISRLA